MEEVEIKRDTISIRVYIVNYAFRYIADVERWRCRAFLRAPKEKAIAQNRKANLDFFLCVFVFLCFLFLCFRVAVFRLRFYLWNRLSVHAFVLVTSQYGIVHTEILISMQVGRDWLKRVEGKAGAVYGNTCFHYETTSDATKSI